MAKLKDEEKIDSKGERVEKLKKKLEADFGKGTLIGGKDKVKFHEFIPTGSLGLDKALGIGGLPKGRIVEIIGWESSGKTTVAIHTIAEAHKNPNSYCAIIDAEHAFDTRYAEALGVDLARLEICQPDYGEQGLEVAEKLAESGDFDVIVIDSVAALVPKSETEREMGESSMGKHAMLMSQAMRKLTPVVAKSNTLMIFINQKREKIGVMFGDASTTPGGNALKFYASVRLDVTRSVTKDNSIIENNVKVGNLTKVKVIKNKVAPPFTECEFHIKYGEGVDKFGELTDIAVESGVFDKQASWYAYEGNKIAQGRAAACSLLKDNDELYREVKDKVQKSFVPKEFEPNAEEIS